MPFVFFAWEILCQVGAGQEENPSSHKLILRAEIPASLQFIGVLGSWNTGVSKKGDGLVAQRINLGRTAAR